MGSTINIYQALMLKELGTKSLGIVCLASRRQKYDIKVDIPA